MTQVTAIMLQPDGVNATVVLDDKRYGTILPVEQLITDDAINTFVATVERNKGIVADALKRFTGGNVVKGDFAPRPKRALGIAALSEDLDA